MVLEYMYIYVIFVLLSYVILHTVLSPHCSLIYHIYISHTTLEFICKAFPSKQIYRPYQYIYTQGGKSILYTSIMLYMYFSIIDMEPCMHETFLLYSIYIYLLLLRPLGKVKLNPNNHPLETGRDPQASNLRFHPHVLDLHIYPCTRFAFCRLGYGCRGWRR